LPLPFGRFDRFCRTAGPPATYAEIDLGPLAFQKKSVNSKKNRLKIKAIVPAGLEPGSIQISVGDYIGWIQVN
jgi:hypothetical protein